MNTQTVMNNLTIESISERMLYIADSKRITIIIYDRIFVVYLISISAIDFISTQQMFCVTDVLRHKYGRRHQTMNEC